MLDFPDFCIYNNYEWDEQKRLSNLQKHGLDFFDVPEVFARKHIDLENDKYGEQRYFVLGIYERMAVVVIYTMRAEKMRIISFRRANKKERRLLIWL